MENVSAATIVATESSVPEQKNFEAKIFSGDKT